VFEAVSLLRGPTAGIARAAVQAGVGHQPAEGRAQLLDISDVAEQAILVVLDAPRDAGDSGAETGGLLRGFASASIEVSPRARLGSATTQPLDFLIK
jgi:hypothetical protein